MKKVPTYTCTRLKFSSTIPIESSQEIPTNWKQTRARKTKLISHNGIKKKENKKQNKKNLLRIQPTPVI